MKILTLTVSNIMSYRQPTEFNFDDLTYIVGPNGSGKSTIIDLLNIAFFRKAWRTNQLTNLIANKDLPAYVKVTFTYGKDRYIVERHISKSRRSSKQDVFYKNGEIVTSGNQNVTDEVKLLVGDQNLWITLVPQRHLTTILDNQTFKKFYTNAFKLDTIDVFVKAINKVYNRFNHEILILNQQIDQYRNQLDSLKFDDNAYKQTKHNIVTLEKQIEFLLAHDLTSDRIQLEKEYTKLEQKLKQLNELKHIQQTTKKYMALFNSDINERKLQIASVLSTNYTDEQIQKMFKINQQKLEETINRLKIFSNTFSNYKSFVRNESHIFRLCLPLYQKYKHCPVDMLVQSDIKQLYDKYKPYALEIIAFLNKKFNLGLDIDATCNTITNQHIQALKALSKLPDDFVSNQTTPTITSHEKQILMSLGSWDNLFDKIRMFNNTIKQFQLSYLTIKASQALSKLQNIAYVSSIKIFENFEDYKRYKEIVNAIQEISKYVTSLTEWQKLMNRSLDKEIEDLQIHMKSLDMQIKELNQKHERIKQQITDLIHQKKKLQEQLTQMESIKAKRDQLQSLIASTKKQLDTLGKKKQKTEELQRIFEMFVKALNTKFRQTFPMIVKSVVERFSFNFDIIIDEEFKLMVKLDDDKVVSPSMLSGAQQSILALAIRYAFARILDIKLPIILDEVTEGFDNSRIDMLKGFINQLSQYNQTIVISHDDRIVSDNVGTIIQLPLNKSEVSC